MLFKKTKRMSVLQITALILVVAFAIVMGACSDDDELGGKEPGGTTPQNSQDEEIDISHLSWGNSQQASVQTLGLQPGDTTAEINLNWYSTGNASGKVAQVRFIRGTLAEAYELIEEDGVVSVAGGNTAHKVTVTGLTPGKSYQYAVSSNGTDWSEEYDFKVPSATGAFKFAVISDPQLHSATWDALNRYTPTAANIVQGSTSKTGQAWIETMQKIVAAGVSFIASGGDQVDTSGGNETEYSLFFAPPGLRNLPFSPVSGNHDNHTNFNWHYNLPNVQTFTNETEPTVAGRNYYYLYNNILFVVLNTAPYAPGTGTSHLNVFSVSDATPHINRFRSTIQAAKAAHPNYDWLIVQHHKSTASVADHLADRDIQGYVEAGFEKLMSDENVDIVLAGHDHVYARSYPLSGRDGGKVSVPNKSFPAASGSTWSNIPDGQPVYLTFTTGSGLKYYAVKADPTSVYANTLYVKDNQSYPYLGEIATGDTSTKFGSTDYLSGEYLPVSNAAFVQPYIPSYCIVDVNGRSIKFSTYPIATASGTVTNAAEAYNFNANTPYDVITVTKN